MGNKKGAKKDVDTRNAVCWASPGCHNKCRLMVDVQDGRIVKIRSLSQKSSSKGVGLTGSGQGCADRMPHFTKWLYDHRQLMHPLKRVGERGENR